MSNQLLSFKTVTKTPDLLRVWWNYLKDCKKREISIHLGYLSSIMDFNVLPTFIEIITRFWDDKRMLGFHQNVWQAENISRSSHPATDRPTSLKLKNMLLLVDSKCTIDEILQTVGTRMLFQRILERVP